MAQTKSLTQGDGSVRVVVADSTPLTGRLIVDVLRRDRRLAITDASDYTVPEHGERGGLAHVEIEIRQDLIGEAAATIMISGYEPSSQTGTKSLMAS